MKEIQLEEMWGKINKALTSENKTFLESKTAKILPNNPTSQGFSADQIRKSLYEGILVLFEWLKTTNNSNVDFNNKVMETLTAITENNEEDKQDLANLKQSLIDGTFNVKYLTWAIMATNDENGNRIIDTYATIERLTQVLEALTQEISDRKAADDLEKKERKEETSAIINSVNQEISDRTNAVSVLNNLITAETENRTSEDEKVLQYAQSVNEALGNAKTDLQGKIDSEAQTRLTNDNEIKASITSKEDSLKALINSVKTELNGSITTLSNRVNNLPTNYVFDTYESMKNDLLNASNTKYKVGDTLFIKEVNKPDYWVSAILSTKGTYGYYEISIQESKVDLSNYVKISELSREAIEEKFLETVENGRTKAFAARSFAATSRNSGIDVNNYAEYGYDGVSFHKNGMEYPLGFPEKDGVFALTSDIPQSLKNPFALTINGKVYDGSSAVEVITETITEHDFVRFWHAGIEIQNDGSEHVLRLSDFDTELEEFSPHISCQYDGPQYYWIWKFPQISGTFAMESQIPTKLSQLTNDGNYQTNTSDLKDNTTTFTTASTRSNVASGEKLSVSFGKIAKYFNDLKPVAFSGSKADIGLGNVDNTSDANKPVSNATQQALNLKANASDVYTKTEIDAGLNKSLYNLGYYDTMVENSDGSYTITRQTGYITYKSDDLGYVGTSSNGLFYFNIDLPFNYNYGGFISNIKYTTNPDIAWGSSEDIVVIANTGAVGDRRIYYKEGRTEPISVQYKLATATTEKVEANHYARYNQSFILEHNKSEAERSCNLYSGVQTCSDSDTRTDFRPKFQAYDNNNTVILSIGLNPITSTNKIVSFTFNKTSNMNRIRFGHNGSANDILLYYDVTNLPNGTYTLSFLVTGYTGTQSFTNIMLNKDSVALPYQPYNQNKHITNNEAEFLKSEAERSANLWDEQWEKGSFVSSTGIPYDDNTIRSKNFIVIDPNKTYRTLVASSNVTGDMQCFFYDANKNYIGNAYYGNVVMTTPSNAYFMKFRISSSYGTTYKNDIAIFEGSTPLPYQPYEGKVVHEKDLGDKLGSYVDTSTRQEINALKRFNNGVALKRDDTGIFQTDDGANLAIKSFGRDLHFYGKSGVENYVANAILSFPYSGENNSYAYTFPQKNGTIALTSDLPTPGIFTKLGNKTNFSFDSGSYLVVANNGLVTVTGTDPLNVGSSANKKFVGIFMATIAEYGGGQSVCVNTEEVFSGEAASATISGPMFTIYKLN